MRCLTISLPLPRKELSPNARAHYMTKARATKNYRRLAALLAMQALDGQRKPRWAGAVASTRWYFKDNRRRDRDNLLASLKAAFDGLTDSGVLEDDCGLHHLSPEMEVDKHNPRVEVTVRVND